MTNSKVAIRRSARTSAGDRPPHGRARLFMLLTLGAGAGSWMAATIANGLLLGVQTIVIDAQSSTAPQAIEAGALFLPVHPVHKTVTVYDPPAAVAPAAPAPVRPAPKPTQPSDSEPSDTSSPDD